MTSPRNRSRFPPYPPPPYYANCNNFPSTPSDATMEQSDLHHWRSRRSSSSSNSSNISTNTDASWTMLDHPAMEHSVTQPNLYGRYVHVPIDETQPAMSSSDGEPDDPLAWSTNTIRPDNAVLLDSAALYTPHALEYANHAHRQPAPLYHSPNRFQQLAPSQPFDIIERVSFPQIRWLLQVHDVPHKSRTETQVKLRVQLVDVSASASTSPDGMFPLSLLVRLYD